MMSCLNIINIFTLTFTDSTLLNFYSSKPRDFVFIYCKLVKFKFQNCLKSIQIRYHEVDLAKTCKEKNMHVLIELFAHYIIPILPFMFNNLFLF